MVNGDTTPLPNSRTGLNGVFTPPRVHALHALHALHAQALSRTNAQLMSVAMRKWIWPTFRDGYGSLPAGQLRWAVSRTRLRSNGRAARPNICLLIILIWLTAFDGAGVPAAGGLLAERLASTPPIYQESLHSLRQHADPRRTVRSSHTAPRR